MNIKTTFLALSLFARTCQAAAPASAPATAQYSVSLFDKATDDASLQQFCQAQDATNQALNKKGDPRYPNISFSSDNPDPLYPKIAKGTLYVIKSANRINGAVKIGTDDDYLLLTKTIDLHVSLALLKNPSLKTLVDQIFDQEKAQELPILLTRIADSSHPEDQALLHDPAVSQKVPFLLTYHLSDEHSLQYKSLLKSLDFRPLTYNVPQCAGGVFYYKPWGITWDKAKELDLCDNEEDNNMPEED